MLLYCPVDSSDVARHMPPVEQSLVLPGDASPDLVEAAVIALQRRTARTSLTAAA